MPSETFSDREYAAAFEPPRISLGGRTYVGVIVSADEWFAIEPRILEAQQDTPESFGLFRALVQPMTDLCFPPPPRWQFWRRSVSLRLARLPLGAQLEALASFTVAQKLAQLGRVAGRTPAAGATGGTSSPS